MRKNKRDCYRQICFEANTNPWGAAYKEVSWMKFPSSDHSRLFFKINAIIFPQRQESRPQSIGGRHLDPRGKGTTRDMRTYGRQQGFGFGLDSEQSDQGGCHEQAWFVNTFPAWRKKLVLLLKHQ